MALPQQLLPKPIKFSHCESPGEKECADLWLQCEISHFSTVSAVACGSRSITPGSMVTMSVIEREKKWDNGVLMVKFVVDLDLGCRSLGSKGSNA